MGIGRGWWSLVAVLLLRQGAYGHHGWSQYDPERSLELIGTVREVGFEHPHVLVRLEMPPPP